MNASSLLNIGFLRSLENKEQNTPRPSHQNRFYEDRALSVDRTSQVKRVMNELPAGHSQSYIGSPNIRSTKKLLEQIQDDKELTDVIDALDAIHPTDSESGSIELDLLRSACKLASAYYVVNAASTNYDSTDVQYERVVLSLLTIINRINLQFQASEEFLRLDLESCDRESPRPEFSSAAPLHNRLLDSTLIELENSHCADEILAGNEACVVSDSISTKELTTARIIELIEAHKVEQTVLNIQLPPDLYSYNRINFSWPSVVTSMLYTAVFAFVFALTIAFIVNQF